jgi:hypothetical protein
MFYQKKKSNGTKLTDSYKKKVLCSSTDRKRNFSSEEISILSILLCKERYLR